MTLHLYRSNLTLKWNCWTLVVGFQDQCNLEHFSKRYISIGHSVLKLFIIVCHQVADTVNSSLVNLFGQYHDLKVIAEPGRYFACSTHTLAVNIISKRSKSIGSEKVIIISFFRNSILTCTCL